MSDLLSDGTADGRQCFFDTNIFVYELDKDNSIKSAVALQLIQTALLNGNGHISYQVVQEFLNVVLTKLKKKMTTQEASAHFRDILHPMLTIHSSSALFEKALAIHGRYKFRWYDSLIVAAALEAKCDVLYTEDLQHGQRFGDLTVVSPFIEPA